MAAATKLDIYQMAARHLADARFALITDDVETRYAFDDAWPRAADFVLRQAAWRFAVKTATLIAGGSAFPGFTTSYALPADHLRTHAIYLVASDGRECPIDLREHGTNIVVNVATVPTIRYVANQYADPATASWPEHFAQTVAAYLAFLCAERLTGERGAAGRMSQLFSSLLPEAARLDALPEDRWLPHQRSGAMLRAARQLLRMGFWRNALVTGPAVSGGTPATGYSYSFTHPADWLRTHAAYQASSGRELPFDLREHAGQWSANIANFTVRYVSTVRGLDSTLWREGFMKALLALIEDGPGNMPDAEGKGSGSFPMLLAAALQTEAEPDNPWLAAQLDGSFLRAARAMIDQGFWRFAMPTPVLITTDAGGGGGFTRQYPYPSDWARTRQLYRLAADGKRCPIDIRERGTLGGIWITNETSFYAEYLSTTLALDATKWPDPYMRAVLRLIEFERAGGERGAPEQAAAAWKDALSDALASEADVPDPWLSHQLDGSFRRARDAVLMRGYWDWALKEVQHDASTQSLTKTPEYGFPYIYDLPADWLRTHALFAPWDGKQCPFNIRESANGWSTDAGGTLDGAASPVGVVPSFVARYISTDVLDASGGGVAGKEWPELVSLAILAWLDWHAAPAAEAKLRQAEYDRLLAEALAEHSRAPDDWLRFQLDGSYRVAVGVLLEKGRWRFAVRTVSLTESSEALPSEGSDGTPSNSYGYRFIHPTDLLKTIWIYYLRGSGLSASRIDIDYRDEGGAFHANYTPLTVRYVSRYGLDATRWPEHFRVAVLSWLEYEEARRDPARTSIAAAKLQLYEKALASAESTDDARDMPPVRNVGRIVSSRFARGSIDQKQGWSWP